MDHADRFINLSLTEPDLAATHVLAAYILKPAEGHDFLNTVASFAAESGRGTQVPLPHEPISRALDVIAYQAEPSTGLVKLAFPLALFDFNMSDGKASITSFLNLLVGNTQSMGEIADLKLHDFHLPQSYLSAFNGPQVTIARHWQHLGRDETAGGMIVGAILKPKLGLRPEGLADAAYRFWLGGDLVENDQPQGNQSFAPLADTLPLMADALKRAQDETGKAKIFSVNITADDPNEMDMRAEAALEAFKATPGSLAFHVDAYLAGPMALTHACRDLPHFVSAHRAGHAAVTSQRSNRGYSAFVLTKINRLMGASGIHTGTMGFGRMEGDEADRPIACMIAQNVAQGPYFEQNWHGMLRSAAIVSGGINALRLPSFLQNLGHSNFILAAGGGAFGHIDGPTAGALSLRQAEACWLARADPFDFAKTHPEFARAFLSFEQDADIIHPGWRAALSPEKPNQ
ncbi:MAG: ribulose-bisphosphate carboxylase [Rhodobacteraceae bacterium]|nr:ribulose-bisphosphate carboxylase [Paracoccaceae bacterium]